MVYKIIENMYGDYIDLDENRYEIFEATKVVTPQGINVGWTEAESIKVMARNNNLVYAPMSQEEAERLMALELQEED